MPRKSNWRELIKSFTSLKLTLVCLALLMALVAACTLAQVDLGTFGAVDVYIRSLFLYWSPPGADWKIPVFPGGGLVGALLLINLVAAHWSRFDMNRRKAGLWIVHFGLVILFLSEFGTAFFAVESRMAIDEGATLNYTESDRITEMAIIDASSPDFDQVTSIPQSIMSKRSRITHESLPFSLRIVNYYANSSLSRLEGGEKPRADKGVGRQIAVREEPPVTRDDMQDIVSAYVEVLDGGKSLGTWLLSSALGAGQGFEFKGKTYRLAIRPQRYYLPYSITLKDFKHDIYPGTDIPKNFSSLIQLKHPQRNEDREILIYMNNPLRYAGKTFYQASFGKNDTLSVLQVVENPGWLLPYISCSLVAIGLLLHFFMHLRLVMRPRND